MSEKTKTRKGSATQSVRHNSPNSAGVWMDEAHETSNNRTFKDRFKKLGHTAYTVAVLGGNTHDVPPKESQSKSNRGRHRYGRYCDVLLITGGGRPHTYEYRNIRKIGKMVGMLEQLRPRHDILSADVCMNDSLAELEIGRKRSSEMAREIQKLRHVKLLTPRPVTRTCVVRRLHPDKQGRYVTVMKPTDPYSAVEQTVFHGPRCDKQGQLVAHSILGDVDTFLHTAAAQGQFTDIFAASQLDRSEPVVARVTKTPELPSNKCFDEQNAMRTWDHEMELRLKEQRRLSDHLQRPEADLLMCTSVDFQKKSEFQRLIEPRVPADVVFWHLPDVQGTGSIRPCLSERGRQPSQVVSGHPASFYQQKGLHPYPSYRNRWSQSNYLQHRDKAEGGIIQIANQVLFDKLEIIGASPVNTCKFGSGSMPVSRGNLKSCDLSVTSEKTLFNEDCQKEAVSAVITGPALQMDGSIYTWKPSNDGCHGNTILKEVFILIETVAGVGTTGQVTLENVGTTILNYYWLKVPDFQPLPVPRPKRRPFYFESEEGVILPQQTLHIPVLLKSRQPGYFTESWHLTTVPILEAGGMIKVTFKGVCRGNVDFSQQRQEIEAYLCQRQIETYCERQVEELVRGAILRASFLDEQLRDDPLPPPGIEELFKEANPGLYYHAHVVKELWNLYSSIVVEGPDTRNVTMVTMQVSEDREEAIMNVAILKKLILALPEEREGDTEEEVEVSNSHKEQYLEELSQKATLLSYTPLLPWRSEAYWRYLLMYTLLQAGIDLVAEKGRQLADRYGLIVKEGVEPGPPSPENKAKTKGKKQSISKGKPQDRKPSKTTMAKDYSPTERSYLGEFCGSSSDQGSEVIPFSPVYKYRKLPGSQSIMIDLYDEKIYTEMYQMLSETLDRLGQLLNQ